MWYAQGHERITHEFACGRRAWHAACCAHGARASSGRAEDRHAALLHRDLADLRPAGAVLDAVDVRSGVFEKTNGPSYIREAVLKGETVKAWTQMITVTGAKDVAGNPQVTPEKFAVSMAAGFKKACPDTFAVKPFGAAKFGDQDGFVAVVGCGRIETSADKHGETALIIAVKGSADYYTIQWAERAPSSADKPAIDEAKWQERLSKLKPIRFCPIVPGEAMPYPSCVDKN